MLIDGASGGRSFDAAVKQPGGTGSHCGKHQKPCERLSILRKESKQSDGKHRGTGQAESSQRPPMERSGETRCAKSVLNLIQ